MTIDYSIFAIPKGSSLKRRKDISITNRDKVKQIFHYQCALCGKKGTQIHHIVYKSEDKSKIDDIDNLILLCTECQLLEVRQYHIGLQLQQCIEDG